MEQEWYIFGGALVSSVCITVAVTVGEAIINLPLDALALYRHRKKIYKGKITGNLFENRLKKPTYRKAFKDSFLVEYKKPEDLDSFFEERRKKNLESIQ